jgi:hypothetical protein
LHAFNVLCVFLKSERGRRGRERGVEKVREKKAKVRTQAQALAHPLHFVQEGLEHNVNR